MFLFLESVFFELFLVTNVYLRYSFLFPLHFPSLHFLKLIHILIAFDVMIISIFDVFDVILIESFLFLLFSRSICCVEFDNSTLSQFQTLLVQNFKCQYYELKSFTIKYTMPCLWKNNNMLWWALCIFNTFYIRNLI